MNFLRKLDKAWCKLFKKLLDTSTVNRQPGSGKPRNARTEVKKTLSFFFRSCRSVPLTIFCRFSGEVTERIPICPPRKQSQ